MSVRRLCVASYLTSVPSRRSVSNLFFLIQDEDKNICAGMDAVQYKLFRKLVIGIIIATDLDNHESDLKEFRAYCGTLMDRLQIGPWAH